MAVLKNRVGVATSTTGTGAITLGAALTSAITPNAANWQTFAGGGVANGDSVRYLILDSNGAWEYGPGVYTTAGTALSRAAGLMDGSVPGQKSSSGSLISLTGTAHVFITAVAEDFPPDLAISKLVGRGSAAGAGPGVEITLGTGLAMAGTTLNAAGAGGLVGQQVFAASGTYTPNPSMAFCIIECVGGGGGGGGCQGSTSNSAGGSGGGSGAYSRAFRTAADVGASKTVTIGAAGAGASNANGTNGGDTYVGANIAAGSPTCLCGARGGSGGLVCNVGSSTPAGGSGGAATGIGDLRGAGSPGGPGLFSTGAQTNFTGASGASSFFGGGASGVALPGSAAVNGSAGSAYGAGGGGAVAYNSGNGTGGAGSLGVVIITEYK